MRMLIKGMIEESMDYSSDAYVEEKIY